MAPRLSPVLTITGIRGRNGQDAPHLIPEDQCREAMNVEFTEGGLAKKRDGVAVHGTTSLTTTGLFVGIYRHVPGADQTAAELWLVSDAGTSPFQRLAAGTAWATPTPAPADTFDGDWNTVSAVSFNGKLYFAINSDVNRLHVWDGTTLRRVGIAPPAGASEAKTAGAITDSRKYKAAVVVKVSSVVVLRSELSAASNAVSLSGERATLTLVTAPSEGETHWEAYAASDDDNYATYRFIGDATIGNTIVDNTNDITAYVTAPTSSAGVFEPSIGANQLPPSCKYLATDGNRILMAGAWETSAGTAQTTPKNSRVWFTPLLGTTGAAYYDDERISTVTGGFQSWVDVGENDGDSITGLGVLDGIPHVFKNERLYRLRPTGDSLVPYLVEEVSKSVGCVAHQSIVNAEDETGAPTLCFWSLRGPYRISESGLRYMGHDIEDLHGDISPSSLGQTWGLFYPTNRQIYWQIRVTGGDEIAVCDVRQQVPDGQGGLRGGWSRFSLATRDERTCGCMFSNTPGATMSRDLKPWLAGYDSTSVVGELEKWDSGTSSTQGHVITRTFAPTDFREPFITKPPTLIAEVSADVSIQGILRADFHANTDQEDTVTLTAGTGLAVGSSTGAGSETRIVKRLDALALSGMRAVSFQLGDNTAVSSAWTLDSLTVPWELPL